MKKTELPANEYELLIVSYLTGSANDEELARLNEWTNLNSENMNHFNSLKNSWIISGGIGKASSDHSEESWNALVNKLGQNRLSNGFIFELESREKASLIKYLKLAASWLLFFSLGSALTWWISGSKKEKLVADSGKTIEITTPLGARSMIRMPDSTLIWLNAGSTIRYGQDYDQQTRTVELTGEAYFKVAKDTAHPFLVNAQGLIVRALGTRFNIKAYPEENTISAILEEGKIDVKVSGMAEDDARILLKPKDKLIYHKETKETEKYMENAEDKTAAKVTRPVIHKEVNLLSNVRTELYTSWKDPRWIFYREPLNTLAPMLERRFNLKIIFDDDQLKKYKFTGIIENETVNQILNALKLSAPLEYQINRDTIRLTLNLRSREEFRRIMIRNN
jgi:ferric-dicitrate binding protein FerR (iron transport regulator)